MNATLTTAVLPHVLEVEAQCNAMQGWTPGVSVFSIHADSDDLDDLAPLKMGGAEPFPGEPLELLEALLPPSRCHRALVLSFSADVELDGKEFRCRYTIAATQQGRVLVVARQGEEKPQVRLMDPIRVLTLPKYIADVAIALHNLAVTTSEPEGLPEGLVAFLRALGIDGGTIIGFELP